MALYYVVFLAVVQGVTEFLPISSSAHLVLGRELMFAVGLPPAEGSAADQLAFDVALHVGSLCAVALYFRREVVDMVLGLMDGVTGRGGPRFRLFLLVAVGTTPIILIGLLAKNIVTDNLRSPEIIAWTTLIFGLALWLADRARSEKHESDEIGIRDAFIIGLLQCLAIVPGVSRSGITMTAGRFLGLSRQLSARFALVLSMPAISGAGLLISRDLYEAGDTRLTADAVLGGVLSFFAAWIAITLMMRWLKHATYTPFVAYRVALGLLLLVLSYGVGAS